jgi:hypothetical protein
MNELAHYIRDYYRREKCSLCGDPVDPRELHWTKEGEPCHAQCNSDHANDVSGVAREGALARG